MMQQSVKLSLLNSLIGLEHKPNHSDIVQCLLPQKPQGGPYTLKEIRERLQLARDFVESVEVENNGHFDVVLDKNALDQLDKLHKNLNKTQLDVMKLQCEIAYTKEQYDHIDIICNNPKIQERRELLNKEANIKGRLQQLKFEPLKEFFTGYTDYLCSTIDYCQKLCSRHTPNHQQLFDWSEFRRIILLLEACGKTLMDVAKFERLYQANSNEVNIVKMTFKMPMESIDYNNFIEFPGTYSLESQLQISLRPNQHQDLKELLSNTNLFPPTPIDHQLSYSVFEQVHSKLEQATRECCKLLVNLNMNYIEAHLTDGINVDRLNGGDDVSHAPTEEQTLPLYAFSPQEYITQIGQHLLTLRKQTEQFESDKNGSLRFSLEYLDQAQNIPIDVKAFKTITEIIMRCIARHCIRSLLARTNKSILSRLTLEGKRQLATDALYLDNVLEDLNLLDLNEPNVERFKSLLIH